MLLTQEGHAINMGIKLIVSSFLIAWLKIQTVSLKNVKAHILLIFFNIHQLSTVSTDLVPTILLRYYMYALTTSYRHMEVFRISVTACM